MPNIIRVQEKNLVLKLSNNVNRNIWNDSKYYDFIDNLTNGRNYQKEAILKCLQFMCSEEYQNILDLIEENYNENQSMKDTYGSFSNLKNMVKFPNSFASSLDLATGSGKSWVIYGLAAFVGRNLN